MPHTNTVELVPNQGWDERILVCRNGALVDTFIVVTTRYVVLVDTVINTTTARHMVNYAQPYLTDGRQLLVVNTHADYDHAWGNQLFVGANAEFPAPILATRRCAEQFALPNAADPLKERQAAEPAIFGEVILTPPTILFDETLTIDGGDLTLELFATPGHTVDHLAIYLPQIATLLAADAVAVLVSKLLPLATLVTPNLPEAARLAGFEVHDLESMERAARAIAALGPRHVLVKGGHLAGSAIDLLWSDGRATVFPGERIDTPHTHGTGCTLSAAITARLARGDDVLAAVTGGRRFIRAAIAGAPGLGGGSGPVDHFAPAETTSLPIP